MMLFRYWFVLETIGIILIFALILLWVLRSVKRRKANPIPVPKAIGGKIYFYFLYLLRIVGIGLGTFLAIAFFVMVERNIYSVITETMRAPSEVNIPPDLPFEVEEVTFEGGDDLMMSGWKVPSQNGATVILLHGYGGNRTMMLWHAKQFADAGYGVLMYDERASGESEGTRRSYGWEDPPDVLGAVRYIEMGSGHDGEHIGIVGCSIGAQIALQSAAYYTELDAVWADGASSVRARDLPPPGNPIMALLVLGNYSLDWAYELKLGIDAPPPMIEIIGDITPRPIMLVGGGQPHPLVGSEGDFMIPRYAHYAGPNAQVWVIPEATHCDGPARRPDEYAERMIEFFDIAFGIKR
ncbi:MAG TPA: alpha/beta fold hydrolase [Anaerolineales bacterium]|nr:alpha/beta fold hydrolase [Anaerolineales bacterium]